MKTEPYLTWVGGKRKEISKILPHVPDDYNTFIEVFVGGGALFFHLNPEKAVINDKDEDLINFYTAIHDGRLKDIQEYVCSTPKSPQCLKDILQSFHKENDPLERAKKYYLLKRYSYRSLLKQKKDGTYYAYFFEEFVTRKNEKPLKALYNSNTEELMKRTTITTEDFEEVFKKYDKTENFMFLDPPYDGCCKNLYIHEFSMEDHKRLFACFKNAKAKCLLIISETEFIRELYKDFIVSHYEYGYSVNNSQASKKTHLVIKKYK